MAAASVQNPPAQGESKSAKKKKAAKAAERTESPAPASLNGKPASVAANEPQDDSSESPYVRELLKNIRNVNKRITNASKTDGLIAEHKDKSLDQLISLKIINADQKAQHLKKPELQKSLAQLEEQLAQYKKIDQEYRARAALEKAELEKSLIDSQAKAVAEAVAEAEKKAAENNKKTMHDNFLVLSQFLRLAAARRAEEANQEVDENLALEGVLLHLYSGDEIGVTTMLKLVEGSNEHTRDVSGEELQTTYAQIKSSAVDHSAPNFPAEPASESTDAPAEPENKHEPLSDLTLANATLTEIDAGTTVPLTNGHHEELPVSDHPANADVANNAANAAAESQWDQVNNVMTSSQEWVQVPRDVAETETGLNATPAQPGNTQSWADDQPELSTEQPIAPADPNDGFHQVQRHRGRGDREGGQRGRGGFRGNRGFRGDGRGRGRGRGGTPFRGGPRRGGFEQGS